MKVLVVGTSTGDVCGVRDHAQLLTTHLAATGLETEMQWGDFIGRPTWRQVDRWLQHVAARAEATAPDAILFHYSVFTLAWRGIPTHVAGVTRRLRSLGVPVVALLHEFVYPWGQRGWRGFAHATSQRAALVAVVRSASRLIVTTADRAVWLRSRPWLPDRPVSFVPLFSNVPVVPGPTDVEMTTGDVAVLGYGAESTRVDVVTQALAAVSDEKLRLVLVGAPGSESDAGRIWAKAARRDGCAMAFTGVLDPETLSTAISSPAIVVFADEPGPTSRKTTLAAALAHGKAIVALDGPNTWDELQASRAVMLVPPQPAALAAAFKRLLDDADARRTLGDRARAFYEERMAVERGTTHVAYVLRDAVACGPQGEPLLGTAGTPR